MYVLKFYVPGSFFLSYCAKTHMETHIHTHTDAQTDSDDGTEVWLKFDI